MCGYVAEKTDENEVLYARLPRARFAGRLSRYLVVRSDGVLRVYRSEVFDLHEALSATGLTSMCSSSSSLVAIRTDSVLGTSA